MHVRFLEGEWGRAVVESETNAQEVHLVDLTERVPLGICSCRHYQCRVWPEFKRSGGKVVTQRCKHLVAVRDSLLDGIIEKMTAN